MILLLFIEIARFKLVQTVTNYVVNSINTHSNSEEL